MQKPIYKTGQTVYSYQNQDKPGTIHTVRESENLDYAAHAYKIILPDGKRSKWIDEQSVSSTPIE